MIRAILAALFVAFPALAQSPPQTTFVGSGQPAHVGMHQGFVVASQTMPEIGAQFTLSGNAGSANKQTAYKIALTASVVAGGASADIYSLNTITHGTAGAGGHLITGIESDVNNIGAHANALGTPTSAYGMVSVAAGTKDSTAAYWATAASTGRWTYGFALSNTNPSSIKEAGFYDASSSVRVLQATGTHTTGIDFLGASMAFGMVLPNNAINAQLDATGILRNTLTLDTANRLQLGWAGSTIVWNGTLRPAGNIAENLGDPSHLIGTGYFYNTEITNQLTYQGKPVSLGAPDSCGAGYRCLRVSN